MRKLGILVSTNRNLDHLVGLCRAAQDKDVEVSVFFTHQGVLTTQDPRFIEVRRLVKTLALCNVGFEAHGLQRPVPGLDDRDYATQARHVEMMESCDRYVKL